MLTPPLKTDKFFPWLKLESEKFWSMIEINLKGYGFQIQQGTKWDPGLNHKQIERYEKELNCKFPRVYKAFLRNMNGTGKPAINVYGNSEEPYRYAPAYYSYPKDLDAVRKMVKWICESFNIKLDDIDGDKIPYILPITGHKFLVVSKKNRNYPVLSIYGRDVVPYSSSLENFLVNDIFKRHSREEGDSATVSVNFWLK